MANRIKVFAHRGGPERAPENTLLAFRRAIDDGADGFECDVVLTKDGEPIIIHKPFYTDSIAKQIDKGGRLNESTWKDLKELKTGGQRIPHLDDLLELVSSSRTECFIEPKIVKAELIEKIINSVHNYDVVEKVQLITFFHRRALLSTSKILDSKIKTCVILVWPFGSWSEKAQMAQADVVVPGWKSLTPWKSFNHIKILAALRLIDLQRKVSETQLEGIPVYSGIADDKETMTWLCELGIDGVFTDNVPLARQVISSR